jgi:uncharacterized protein (DUF2267 family)
MTTTGLDAFDKTIHKTNTLLKQIETELGWENQRNMSYAVLRAVLHALRDRLTVQEAADLSAQFPLLVQGIFYDGWNPSGVPKKIHKDGFLEEIRKNFTLSIDRSINEVVIVVLSVLRKHVSEGELEDVLSVLPKDLSLVLKQLE